MEMLETIKPQLLATRKENRLIRRISSSVASIPPLLPALSTLPSKLYCG